MAGAELAAHCCPDARLRDYYPELPDVAPFGLVAEAHSPGRLVAVRAPDEHCCFLKRLAGVLTHLDAEHYCPVILDAGLLRRGEQPEHSPVRRVAERLPA
jgi:hypothetical protein